jgi:hypothetical protein
MKCLLLLVVGVLALGCKMEKMGKPEFSISQVTGDVFTDPSPWKAMALKGDSDDSYWATAVHTRIDAGIDVIRAGFYSSNLTAGWVKTSWSHKDYDADDVRGVFLEWKNTFDFKYARVTIGLRREQLGDYPLNDCLISGIGATY